MAKDNPVLVRHLADFCAELLRANPIGARDRIISSEDVQAHVAALTQHFNLALEHHGREPSFSSSMVIAVLAMLFHDRATEATTRPSPGYQALRRLLEKALESAIIPRGFGHVGNVNLHLLRTSRTIDDLRFFAHSGRGVTLGFPEAEGVVLISDYDDVYRFAVLQHPTHTCTEPPAALVSQRATLTEVTETGTVSFTVGCGCVYVADGLELDRP